MRHGPVQMMHCQGRCAIHNSDGDNNMEKREKREKKGRKGKYKL